MKLSRASLILGAVAPLPGVQAWGSLGHITTAYLATEFVAPPTASHFQALLRNSTEDYLAGVATWADTIRYTKWGRFTSNFHFIDAKDHPPDECNVDMDRDCKATGCVITALHNYTARALDPRLPFFERQQAAKFVVHFVGDIHQPLHTEDVARGGNGIHVQWQGNELNLHHVWDSSIAEKLLGTGRRSPPYKVARSWADKLAREIREGKYEGLREEWLRGLDIDDPVATALAWARECNLYVCSHVLPEGPEAIVGQELSGKYYELAAPVIELQVARAGYRMAAWLDAIANGYAARVAKMEPGDL